MIKTYSVGEGATVLILGGGPGMSSAAYRTSLPQLLPDYRTLFVDYRGTGASPKAANYSVSQDVNDVEVAMGREKDVTVLAHSYGGLVALALARRKPQWLRRLVFVSALPTLTVTSQTGSDRMIAKMGEEALEELVLLSQRAMTQRLNDEDRATLNHAIASYHLFAPKDEDLAFFERNLGYDPTVLLQHADYLEVDFTDVLPTLTVPTALILGVDDPVIPLEHASVWSEKAPHTLVTQLANCGHWPFIEQPAAFVAAWEAFVNAPV